MSARRIVLGAVSLACLTLGFAGASAQASPQWLAPVELSPWTPEANVQNVEVVGDARGDTLAVWEHTYPGPSTVEAAFRTAGGQWQTPVQLNEAGHEAGDVHAALNARGEAAAVWSDYSIHPGETTIMSSLMGGDGKWRAPQLVAAPRVFNIVHSHVALENNGNAVAVWGTGGSEMESATMPAGGTWSAPTTIGEGCPEGGPQVIMDEAGEALASWDNAKGGCFEATEATVETAARPAGGPWQPPVALSSSGISRFGGVALDGHGGAVAVWTRQTGSEPPAVEAALRPDGGAWQASRELSNPLDESYGPQVAENAHGEAVASWQQYAGPCEISAMTAAMGRDGSWGPSAQLAPREPLTEYPKIAIGPNGEVEATWEDRSECAFPPQTQVIQGSVRSRGGRWQAPVDLTPAEEGNRYSLYDMISDGPGDAIAVWVHYRGEGSSIEVDALAGGRRLRSGPHRPWR